jgi:hypothetical protein
MNLINSFFLLPKKGKFLDGFTNEQLKSQADNVWRQLDGLSPVLLLAGVAIGIALAVFYYTAYNEMPGRHYKIKHWGIWAILSFVLTLLITVVIEYVFIKTNLKSGISSLYWLCAINNALYCFILYFITSFVWCNLFRTNAYKFLKK